MNKTKFFFLFILGKKYVVLHEARDEAEKRHLPPGEFEPAILATCGRELVVMHDSKTGINCHRTSIN